MKNTVLFYFFLWLSLASQEQEIAFPRCLKKGDVIGLFTPSWPAHIHLREKYLHALTQIKESGFDYIEGKLTAQLISQGYRTASAEERAEEFMELIRNPKVSCLMATIGGYNSSSLIPFLDFDEIRESRKIICGYSDLTALHLAILKYSGLSTFYGPSLVPSFGESPTVLPFTIDSFFQMATATNNGEIQLLPPREWSDQFIDAKIEGWQKIQREFHQNMGWKTIVPGRAEGVLIIANLEVLIFSAGTPYFPDLKGKILLLEETAAHFPRTERCFQQLMAMGVFDELKGLILSKPGNIIPDGAPFSYEELICEVIGKRDYPIICQFDCGHTFPSLTIPEGSRVYLKANEAGTEISIKKPICMEN